MSRRTLPRQITPSDWQFFVRAIKNDIPASIEGGANFLTVLGLVCYTEFVGGILNNQVGVDRQSRPNFNAGFYAMGKGYEIFDDQVSKQLGEDFYTIVRCGFTHEYFAKQYFVVAPVNKDRSGLGVGWTAEKRVGISTSEYYRDLLAVIESIYA